MLMTAVAVDQRGGSSHFTHRIVMNIAVYLVAGLVLALVLGIWSYAITWRASQRATVIALELAFWLSLRAEDLPPSGSLAGWLGLIAMRWP
jgi:hypothetical protein